MTNTETTTAYHMTVTVTPTPLSAGFSALSNPDLDKLYQQVCALERQTCPTMSKPKPKVQLEIGEVPLTAPLSRLLFDYLRPKVLTHVALHDVVFVYLKACFLKPELTVATIDHPITPRILFESLVPHIGGWISVELEEVPDEDERFSDLVETYLDEYT